MLDTRKNPFNFSERNLDLDVKDQTLEIDRLDFEKNTDDDTISNEEEYKFHRPHKLIKEEKEENLKEKEKERSELRKTEGVEFIKKGKEKRREELDERREEREELKEERLAERERRKKVREEEKEKRESQIAWKKKKRKEEEGEDEGGTYITHNGLKITGNPENGVYEFHKPKKRIMATYKNGKKNGPCLTYNHEGTLTSRVHYVDDKLNGPAVQFYPNGKEKVILHYKDNIKDGLLITHSPNGMKLMETTYVKNMKEGKFTAFDMFGDIAQVSYYKNNVRHGPATTYFPKSYGGHICRISHYKDGLQVDVEQTFYTTGEEMQSTTYDQGRALNYPIKFDKSGKVLTDPAANKNRNSGG